MDTERQAVAGAFDRLQHLAEPVGAVAHHMQHRAEYFLGKLTGIGQFENMRGDIIAAGGDTREMHPCLLFHAGDMRIQPLLCLGIDHRTDMRGGICGIADDEFARRTCDHLDHAVGDVVLNEQQPQRRAALAGGTKRRGHDVVGDLLGQGGGIDDHRIDAAGLRDQWHDRPILGSQHAVDKCARLQSNR